MIISTVHDLLTEVTMDPLMPYQPPDFDRPPLSDSPCVRLVPAPADGIAPRSFHATSNFPEYINLAGTGWTLIPRSRMDAVIVVTGGSVEVTEPRRLRAGDPVVVGRSENGEEGIFVHPDGFCRHPASADKFIFRSRGTRETPFSRSYDDLYRILRRQTGQSRLGAGPGDFDQCPGFHRQSLEQPENLMGRRTVRIIGIPIDLVVLIGIRDLDRQEREQLSESGCTTFTMRDIDEIGMYGVLQKTMNTLSRFERIHISLDMEGLDTNEAPGVGTPVPGDSPIGRPSC